MPRNDDSQYELVLGNRQLVSGFFVLIILFAVFLALGYVLGRNSLVKDTDETVTAQQESAAPRASSRALDGAPAPSSTVSNNRPSPSQAVVEEPTTTVPDRTQANMQPQTRTGQPVTQPTPEVEQPAQQPVTPPAKPASDAKTQAILNSKVSVITPRKGDTFVQVAAIGKAEAELMAMQLQRRGYRAFISEVPGKDLFRVLVGPFETPTKLAETKKKLDGEGISTIVQRY